MSLSARLEPGRGSAPRPRRFGRVNWIGLWALYRRDVWRVVKRYRETFVGVAVSALLFRVAFGLAGGNVAMPGGVSLAQFLPAKADVWDKIVSNHGLRPIPMSELVGESHHYADFCFAYGATEVPPAAFVSTVKIKQAGFTEAFDTEESFRYWLQVLIDRKVLPPA